MLRGLVRTGVVIACVGLGTRAEAQVQGSPPGDDAALTTPGDAAPVDPSLVAPEPEPVDLRLVEARAQFTAGQAAFDAGAWAPALVAFERAHSLTGSPELLYNIAISLERVGQLDRALESYNAYLREVPDAPDRATVESRARTLRAQIDLRRARAREEARTLERERERFRAMLRARTAAAEDDRPTGGLLSKWWFWTTLGVVAAGTAAVSLALVLSPSPPPAVPGSNGFVLTALTVGP